MEKYFLYTLNGIEKKTIVPDEVNFKIISNGGKFKALRLYYEYNQETESFIKNIYEEISTVETGSIEFFVDNNKIYETIALVGSIEYSIRLGRLDFDRILLEFLEIYE